MANVTLLNDRILYLRDKHNSFVQYFTSNELFASQELCNTVNRICNQHEGKLICPNSDYRLFKIVLDNNCIKDGTKIDSLEPGYRTLIAIKVIGVILTDKNTHESSITRLSSSYIIDDETNECITTNILSNEDQSIKIPINGNEILNVKYELMGEDAHKDRIRIYNTIGIFNKKYDIEFICEMLII